MPPHWHIVLVRLRSRHLPDPKQRSEDSPRKLQSHPASGFVLPHYAPAAEQVTLSIASLCPERRDVHGCSWRPTASLSHWLRRAKEPNESRGLHWAGAFPIGSTPTLGRPDRSRTSQHVQSIAVTPCFCETLCPGTSNNVSGQPGFCRGKVSGAEPTWSDEKPHGSNRPPDPQRPTGDSRFQLSDGAHARSQERATRPSAKASESAWTCFNVSGAKYKVT
jgi:hypothetical protein